MDRSSSPGGSRWRLPAVFLLLIAAGLVWWLRYGGLPGSGSQPVTSAEPQAVPVSTALSKVTDFPVYLDGLGTVQAFNTVTVRTRVDGQIDKIAFTEGQLVREGDLLAHIDPRPLQAALDQAKAKLMQDEAVLANARIDLQRYAELSKGDAVSAQQYATQKSLVAQLTAQIAGDQAAADNATTQLSYTSIRSPLTGIAGFRLIDQGNLVSATAQTAIVTIAQIEPISVVFTAPEDRVTGLNAAFAAGPLTVAALSADGKRVLSEGTVAVINNSVDAATGTIRLKGTFTNHGRELWPGLSVATRLLTTTLKGITAVPEDAVKRGTVGLYVYVVNSESKAELRDIKTGETGNGLTVITQGLTPGERVVTAGQYRLAPGMPVKYSREQAGAAVAGETR